MAYSVNTSILSANGFSLVANNESLIIPMKNMTPKTGTYSLFVNIQRMEKIECLGNGREYRNDVIVFMCEGETYYFPIRWFYTTWKDINGTEYNCGDAYKNIHNFGDWKQFYDLCAEQDLGFRFDAFIKIKCAKPDGTVFIKQIPQISICQL